MTDSNNDSNQETLETSADAEQESEKNEFIKSILSAIVEIIMAIKSNPDNITKFTSKMKLATILYTTFWLFAIVLVLIGGGLLFGGDKDIGEKILFTAVGLISGFFGGFGLSAVFHNKE